MTRVETCRPAGRAEAGSGAFAAVLRDGRLHLQHGPIDLILDGQAETAADRSRAFYAATAAFHGLLQTLVDELPRLRSATGPMPDGPVARAMVEAVAPFSTTTFVTPMAAVAGAVADRVLAAMTSAAALSRAYVNNGGDIAIALGPGHAYRLGITTPRGERLGTVALTSSGGVGGAATSGFGGRSLSLGVACSVTVLAASAAQADVAATLIANAVDLPGHPEVERAPATQVDPMSDLGDTLVVIQVGQLSESDVFTALDRGAARAEAMVSHGRIIGAILCLRGATRLVGGKVDVRLERGPQEDF